MKKTLRLTVLTGPHKGDKFCFCGAAQCLIGRANDCFVQLCGTERDQRISRHHCRMALDASCFALQDLGSQNGTFLNGRKVDAVELGWSTENDQAPPNETQVMLKQGDLLTIGGTTFRIDVVDCPPPEYDLPGQPIWKPGETAKKNCPIPCI